MDCSLPRLLHPWDFPGKSTAVGCHFLLQGIFLTQQSNPGLLPCRQMLFHLSHRKVLNLIPKIVLKLRLTHNKFYMASSQIKDVLLWKTTTATRGTRLLDSLGEGKGGMIWENSIETCILSCVKQIASPGSMHETGRSGLVHWDDPEGRDGEGGWEGGSGWRTHVHPWLIHVNVWQKPLQYCN